MVVSQIESISQVRGDDIVRRLLLLVCSCDGLAMTTRETLLTCPSIEGAAVSRLLDQQRKGAVLNLRLFKDARGALREIAHREGVASALECRGVKTRAAK